MQWEVNWKVMMSELGEGAKIPDLWRMSALLEICPQDMKEQMLLRLDEVGENYENLKVKVTSYTSNKAEESRGQKETAVPMELDYVSGSEMYEKEESDLSESRRERKRLTSSLSLKGMNVTVYTFEAVKTVFRVFVGTLVVVTHQLTCCQYRSRIRQHLYSFCGSCRVSTVFSSRTVYTERTFNIQKVVAEQVVKKDLVADKVSLNWYCSMFNNADG